MEPFSRSIEDYPEGIILPVDKPYRWTSADVIRKVKYAACRHFGRKNLKVGHAGTLDPLATGILLVCIGPATRRAEELQRSAKQYVAGVTFGATTPSYDLEKGIDTLYPFGGVCEASIRAMLPGFEGEQEQIAPLFSAKSVDGVRAYEMARRMYRESQRSGTAFNHEQSELLSRQNITIYGLELLDFRPAAVPSALSGPVAAVQDAAAPEVQPADRRNRINVADISGYDLPSATIRVDCSKGTYIRALARDMGEALGTGAFLNSLRRTKNGGFSIEDAVSMDQAMELLSQPAFSKIPAADGLVGSDE